MDVQFKELIEKIKTEGVKNAEEKSAEIIAKAEKKAAEIIEHARQEADDIILKAREESNRLNKTGKEALKQAGRDLILNVKVGIENLFKAVIAQNVKKVLEDAIVTLVKTWSIKKIADLKLLLSQADLDKVEQHLKSELAEEIKKGIEIKPSKNLDAGFYVAEKDGSAYYNFSADLIAELLSEYLNPRLAEIMKDAAVGSSKP
ncbi:MAG: V-type ATP synthase subunit E [Spirochaetota bacterium]